MQYMINAILVSHETVYEMNVKHDYWDGNVTDHIYIVIYKMCIKLLSWGV